MSCCERWTHRLAVVLAVVTLALPVMMGSLTTTLGAGMAFLDWPTSDGQNMLFYDIFHDIRVGNVDKVAEHGHRLAGMVVGLLSIPLAIVGWFDRRRGVRAVTMAILLGVIAQGLLGGMRVRLDDRVLAMIHSVAAAMLVALMGLAMVLTSGRRPRSRPAPPRRVPSVLVGVALLLPMLILGQYVAGGLVRHFGMAIPEHLAGAAIVAIAAVAAAMWSLQSGIDALIRPAWGLFAVVAAQVLLGVGAWAGKFGLATLGVVAVERGVLQVTLRTLHTAGGMLLLMAAAMLALAVVRSRLDGTAGRSATGIVPREASSSLVGGQLAGGMR